MDRLDTVDARHQHAHDELARHVHRLDDASVQALDAQAAELAQAGGPAGDAGVATLLLAWLTDRAGLLVSGGVAQHLPWPVQAAVQWQDAEPRLAERPPRALRPLRAETTH